MLSYINLLWFIRQKKDSNMDNNDIFKAAESTKRLVQDENYYKYIFKKTEKIVSVVFYITQAVDITSRSETYVEDILKAGRSVHDAILKSLEVRAHVSEEVIREAAHSLIVLESKLRVSQAVGLVAPEVTQVLSNEIDSVLRGMNKYLQSSGAFDDLEYTVALAPEPKKPRVPASSRSAGPTKQAPEASPAFDRRERIKTVLEAKGEATIKDICEVITDVSSKTIQRELNSMIEDNVVKRQGERRWSKYSMF